MNLLRRIKIENVKGKDVFEVKFTDFIANRPNIVVAPNGYGKSTIAVAFKSATNGKMKISKNDLYNGDINNHPKLEVELSGAHAGTYVSTDVDGNISKNINVCTINSPLYAKSTSRRLGGNIASTADLRVEQVVVFNRIPESCSFKYSNRNIAIKYKKRGKLFVNISEMLNDCNNIESLLKIKDCLKKCCTQQGAQEKFTKFLNGCLENGSAKSIKDKISKDEINAVCANRNINDLLDCISKMNRKPDGWSDIDTIFTAIQLCDLYKSHLEAGDNDILKNVCAFLSYKQTKALIDERLDMFNTTKRSVRTHEDHGKLVINFERASSMSNGERDILSFVSNLAKYEVAFKKQVGILIIDEVFDYLDGSNMLAVQYYLSQLIDQCRASGKILFPIIFTHLDPKVFTNYYFSKKQVHYILMLYNKNCQPILKDFDI